MWLDAAVRTALFTAAVVLLTAAPAHAVTARAAAEACPGASAVPEPRGVAQVERTVLCLINLERTERGLRALRSNPRLAKAADGHSRAMVARDFFSHDGPGGSTMSRRVKASGYLDGARGYAMGENIAWGTGVLGTPLRIHQAWMRSPGHKANILHRGFEEVGVGVVVGAPGHGSDGATYTTDFGARG
jgi:uncharacterized protein YkwD